jgi:hypothetical protein
MIAEEHAYIHAIETSKIKYNTLIGVGADAVVLTDSSTADSASLEPFSTAISSGVSNTTNMSATSGQISDHDPQSTVGREE